MTEEDVGNGWKRLIDTKVCGMPRQGWPGVWDSLVSAVTGRPLKLVDKELVFSVYVKNPDNKEIKLDIWGKQIEQKGE